MSNANVEYTARVVVDMTPEMKTGLKLLATTRGVSVMDLIRDLVEKELASKKGLSLATDAIAATRRKLREDSR